MNTIALDATLVKLRPMLLKIARLQLRNETSAEDVVSETMLAALEGAARFRRPVAGENLGGRDPQAQDHRPVPQGRP